MHLVVDHVAELKHIDYANCCRLVEFLTCATVVEVRPTDIRHSGLTCQLSYLLQRGTVEYWRRELEAKDFACPSEDCLVDLAEVHTRRHAERVQHDVDRSPILEEWHVLRSHNVRDDTLVTVTTCHLVAYPDLTLLGNEYFGQLNDARRQFVADSRIECLPLLDSLVLLELLTIVVYDRVDKPIYLLVARPTHRVHRVEVYLLENSLRELDSRCHHVNTIVVLDPL